MNGNGNKFNTLIAVGGGTLAAAVTVIFNLFLGVSSKAEIALDVARQHGQELLEVRAEVALMRADLRSSTRDRYYRAEAEREIARLETQIGKYHND